MIPRTLSATSLSTFNECPARWQAQYGDRIPDDGEKAAADLGTAVHAALEDFVMKYKSGFDPTDKNQLLDLLTFFKQRFTFLFGGIGHPFYEEGVAMLEQWFSRDALWGINQVVSCEVKSTFGLKTSIGEIPFNYIWDRCDIMNDGHIRVVDYKTQRLGYGPDKIKKMIQPRIYSLAAAIQFKGSVEGDIEVEMDLLRHEPVSAFFTREDNTATYRWLQELAEKIIAEDPDAPTYKLNDNCRYCPIKSKCPRLTDHVSKGGILGVDPEQAPVLLAQAQYRMKALESYAEELANIVLAEAEKNDVLTWETADYDVSITAKRRRTLDSSRAAHILGPQLQAKYGQLRLGDIDKMIKSGEINEEQAKEIKNLMSFTYSSPSVKVEPKIPFEEAM